MIVFLTIIPCSEVLQRILNVHSRRNDSYNYKIEKIIKR